VAKGRAICPNRRVRRTVMGKKTFPNTIVERRKRLFE
jgi:hypothetical protein